MKQYKSPDRDNGRYADWLFDYHETNYCRFRHIWIPMNKFDLYDLTHGSDAYDKQVTRSLVKRWERWEGMSSDLMMFTYPEEIKKAYSKRKVNKNKSVYKQKRRP